MMHIPTPGTITNVSGIPADLRAIAQWILWKPMLRGNKLTKTPVYWADPFGENVNAHDPKYWGTFDQVYAAMRADNAGRFGIGLVLDNTGIICIDYDDHVGDDANAVRDGAAFMAELSMLYPTYVERSLQGGGKHAFYHAVLPHGRTGGVIEQLNLEIYAAQFIAITGNQVIGSHPNVNPGQALVDSWNLPPPVAGAGDVLKTHALGRVLNADDSQVVMTLVARRPATFKMMNDASDMSDRSLAYAQIIGDLDKITGDPDQIDRIIRKAPFFKSGYNREPYEEQKHWLGRHNCTTKLEYWLKQARRDNNDNIPIHIDVSDEQKAFMTAVVESTIAALKQAHKTETLAAAATELDISYDVRGDDPIAQLLFMLEDNIPGNYDELSIPPGAVGDFVNALGSMLIGPRLTYALPAVISTLSGYLGQTFKTPDFEMGLVNHFIIAGQMNTGKTTTMTVFGKAVDLALSGWYRNPSKPTSITPEKESPAVSPIRRVIATRAASVQGLFDAVSHIGSGVWFADEAETQIEVMSASTPHGVALKAFYKQTFDQSQALSTTSLDGSRASTNLGMTPILNMTLPTYFSCTSEVFENIGTKELVDGTYSRVNMIYDERPMDANGMNGAKLHQGFPLELAKVMQRIAQVADDTAKAYDQDGLTTLMKQTIGAKAEKTKEQFREQMEVNKRAGAAKVVRMEFSPEAEKLHERISAVCRRLGHDANPHVGKWPPHYQILARTDLLPVMIAGVLASCDMMKHWCRTEPVLASHGHDDRGVEVPNDFRKNMPQVIVHEHHLKWAFEFVMYWRLTFFKAWDQGKIAVQMSDDEVVMERLVTNALRSKEAFRVENAVWVPQSYVVKQAKKVAPFKTADIAGRAAGRAGSTMMAHQTLDRMVSNGHILRVKPSDIGLHTREQIISIATDR